MKIIKIRTDLASYCLSCDVFKVNLNNFEGHLSIRCKLLHKIIFFIILSIFLIQEQIFNSNICSYRSFLLSMRTIKLY